MVYPRQSIYPTDRSWVNVTTATGTNLFTETGRARATLDGQEIRNGLGDDEWVTIDYVLHVGPYFTAVHQVAPLVHISRWGNDNADEDDRQGFEMSATKWTLLEYNPPGGFQVGLVFSLTWRGEKSWITRFGYSVTIEGDRIIQDVEGQSGFVDLPIDL